MVSFEEDKMQFRDWKNWNSPWYDYNEDNLDVYNQLSWKQQRSNIVAIHHMKKEANHTK